MSCKKYFFQSNSTAGQSGPSICDKTELFLEHRLVNVTFRKSSLYNTPNSSTFTDVVLEFVHNPKKGPNREFHLIFCGVEKMKNRFQLMIVLHRRNTPYYSNGRG